MSRPKEATIILYVLFLFIGDFEYVYKYMNNRDPSHMVRFLTEVGTFLVILGMGLLVGFILMKTAEFVMFPAPTDRRSR